MKSITLVTRPAADSVGAVLDQVQMSVYKSLGVALPDVWEATVAASSSSSSSSASTSPPSPAAASHGGFPAGMEPPPECPVHNSSKAAAAAAAPPKPFERRNLDLDKLTPSELSGASQKIQIKCKGAFEALQSCADLGATDLERQLQCERASVALFHCIGTVVCAADAAKYETQTGSEAALNGMMDCVRRFEVRASEVRRAGVAGPQPS